MNTITGFFTVNAGEKRAFQVGNRVTAKVDQKYTVSAEKLAEEKAFEEKKPNDVDYFKTLCKKYPSASFGVEDRSLEATDPDWLPKRFSGNSREI